MYLNNIIYKYIYGYEVNRQLTATITKLSRLFSFLTHYRGGLYLLLLLYCNVYKTVTILCYIILSNRFASSLLALKLWLYIIKRYIYILIHVCRSCAWECIAARNRASKGGNRFWTKLRVLFLIVFLLLLFQTFLIRLNVNVLSSVVNSFLLVVFIFNSLIIIHEKFNIHDSYERTTT